MRDRVQAPLQFVTFHNSLFWVVYPQLDQNNYEQGFLPQFCLIHLNVQHLLQGPGEQTHDKCLGFSALHRNSGGGPEVR